LLETDASSDVIDAGDDDEPEAMDVEDEAEACLDKLCQHGEAGNLPSDATCLLDRFGHQMQSPPTPHHFFRTEKKKTSK
jgi:hypothetical protein